MSFCYDDNMKLERLTKDHIADLISWFQESVEGNEFIDYYKDPEAWLELVESRPERHAFVATIAGRIVGFADIEFDKYVDMSFAFGVKPELRGKGYGRKLLDEIVSYAKTHDAKTIKGGVEKQNIACRRLLESTGFYPAIDDDDTTEYVKQL